MMVMTLTGDVDVLEVKVRGPQSGLIERGRGRSGQRVARARQVARVHAPAVHVAGGVPVGAWVLQPAARWLHRDGTATIPVYFESVDTVPKYFECVDTVPI